MGYLGNFGEGEIVLEKGLRNAFLTNDPMALGQVEFFSGGLFRGKGDWDAARPHLENSIKYLEATNWIDLLGQACALLGNVCAYTGDPETGRRHVEKGLKILRDIGVQWWMSLGHYYASHIYLELGDLEKARGAAEEALRLSRAHNAKHGEGWSQILLGRILEGTEPSNTHKAEESILKGIETLQEFQMKPSYAEGYLWLGEHYLNTGKKQKARQNLKKAEGLFRGMGMDYWLTRTQEVLGRV